MHAFWCSRGVILQKHVGAGAKNRVLTSFSDKSGRVVRAVLGEVILEEVGKTSCGNHSAIITRPLDNTCLRLIDFLNKIKYVGVANVDIMNDGADDYVLELNTRQGRSCDYLRAAGVNIGELFVKSARGEKIEPSFSYREIYWHYPPHKSVKSYADVDLVPRAEQLEKMGAGYSPYKNSFEGIVRRMYVAFHNIRLSRRIKKDYNQKGYWRGNV